MARVDFYLLDSAESDARQQFACRLVAKAGALDHRVHIIASDQAQVDALDKLLWTYDDASFVAHDRWPGESIVANITLGAMSDGLPDDTEVCVNLSDTVAPTCERVAEIISANADAKSKGRERYLAYRERGADMKTHQLGSA